MYIFQPPKRTGFKRFVSVKNVFAKDECERIATLFEGEGLEAGVRAKNSSEPDIRISRVTWIKSTPETRWIFIKLTRAVTLINDKVFQFQLSGFYEQLQLTKYSEGAHYTWHEDNAEPEHTTRKLSLSVQLSDPSEYEGGRLKIFPNESGDDAQGSVTFFPSFVTHKVAPVVSGTRLSLVAWVTGEPFR